MTSACLPVRGFVPSSRLCRRRFATALLSLAAATGPAAAATVVYGAVDLPDAVAGDDLWRYEYTISGAFAAFDTLTIEFASGLHEQVDLTIPPATLLAQPIVAGFPGASTLLMVTAMSDLSFVIDTAAVTFVWRGTGTPGAQDFSVADDNSDVYQVGVTRLFGAAVPEPATWALLLATLAPGALARRAGPRKLPPPQPS